MRAGVSQLMHTHRRCTRRARSRHICCKSFSGRRRRAHRHHVAPGIGGVVVKAAIVATETSAAIGVAAVSVAGAASAVVVVVPAFGVNCNASSSAAASFSDPSREDPSQSGVAVGFNSSDLAAEPGHDKALCFNPGMDEAASKTLQRCLEGCGGAYRGCAWTVHRSSRALSDLPRAPQTSV